MPYMTHRWTIENKIVKCDSCGKDWRYQVLCPLCWNKTLEAVNDNNWKCMKCGGDLLVEQDADEKVKKIICPKCRIVYLAL